MPPIRLPFWKEKRIIPPEAGLRWGLTACVILCAAAEASLRAGMPWRWQSLAVAAAPALLLPWRRREPFLVFALAFAAVFTASFIALGRGIRWDGLYSNMYVLALPYGLLRWGSGREGIIGMAVLLGTYGVMTVFDSLTKEDAIGGAVVLILPAAIGATVRFRAAAHLRELERAKLLEREQLAREMHDSLGHHLSSMVIHAQAGRALAGLRPEAATDALAVIEDAGRKSLADLRAMVRVLRREGAERAPQPGLAEIRGLAAPAPEGGPRVEVGFSGDLSGLPPRLESALYRLAQESVTNALRHAAGATAIRIRLEGSADRVRLTIRDDGAPGDKSASGFGLVGMAERAKLLGGTLAAGPDPGGGWTVAAELPKGDATA